jgi:ATP synthase protein I
MSRSDGGDGRGEISPDERKAFERRVAELDKRLGTVSAEHSKVSPAPASAPPGNKALGYGMQMALDLVVGPAVGAGIGWGLDRLFGTRPVLLIAFAFLGLGAGVLNLMRTYRQIQAEAGTDLGKDLPAGNDGDDD